MLLNNLVKKAFIPLMIQQKVRKEQGLVYDKPDGF
jgi:hypothetical protein